MDLLDLDACEVYLGEKGKKNLNIVFHAGRMRSIWEAQAAQDESNLLVSQYLNAKCA